MHYAYDCLVPQTNPVSLLGTFRTPITECSVLNTCFENIAPLRSLDHLLDRVPALMARAYAA
jgi:hypothetical protein